MLLIASQRWKLFGKWVFRLNWAVATPSSALIFILIMQNLAGHSKDGSIFEDGSIFDNGSIKSTPFRSDLLSNLCSAIKDTVEFELTYCRYQKNLLFLLHYPRRSVLARMEVHFEDEGLEGR